MRNNIISSAAVAASAILLTLSCTKQEEMQSVNKGKTFIATIEQAQTKTTLEDNGDGKYFVNWSDGDLININGGAIYSANPDTRKSGYAEFTLVKGQDPTPPYAAVYPSSLINPKDSSFYFPQVQQYEAGRCNAPMVARSENEKLEFHNICGVICFSLTGAGSVRGIELSSASHPLWGRFRIDIYTWVAEIEEDESQIIGGMGMGMGMVNTNSVALDCGEDGVQLNPEKPTDFYLYLPAGEYAENDLSVNITGTEGGEFSMTAQNAVTVERNCVYPFEWNVVFENSASVDTMHFDPVVVVERIDIDALTLLLGEFTVDSVDTKVRFTSGNLVYSTTQSKWGLEGQNATNLVNLFLWHDDPVQAILDTATSVPSTNYLFCDGHRAVFGSESEGVTLSVLSKDQWDYILFKRNCEYRFTKTVYAGMPGLLLFPDVLTQNAMDLIAGFNNVENKPISEINKADVAFPTTELTETDFENLKKEGCVFLPAEGLRIFQNDKLIVESRSEAGCYWGVSDEGYALLNFAGGESGSGKVDLRSGAFEGQEWAMYSSAAYGASIRLVQVIPAAQEAQSQEGQAQPAQGEPTQVGE